MFVLVAPTLHPNGYRTAVGVCSGRRRRRRRRTLLHHVHGHLRGGAILASVARTAGALLATRGVADHVHGVHISVGQVLALGKGSGGGGGAEQASLGLLGAGGQAGGGGEVVSVQVVGVVQGEGVVGALLHVVAPAEHVGGGRGGSGGGGGGRAGATSGLHHVLQLRGRERAQLAAVGVHLAPGAATGIPAGQRGVVSAALHAGGDQGGSPLR